MHLLEHFVVLGICRDRLLASLAELHLSHKKQVKGLDLVNE